MDETKKHELYFLIAKLLRSEFPSIGSAFIHECEIRQKLPSLVFSSNPTFEHLENVSLNGVPDDQLIRLVQLASPNQDLNSSLLFNAAKTYQTPSFARCTSAHIMPTVSPLYGFAPIARLVGHYAEIYCLAFDKTNQVLITGSDDTTVKVWNYAKKRLIGALHLNRNVISDIQVHPSNKFFAVSSHDTSIHIISLRDLSVIHTISLNSEIHSIRFSPCGEFLAAALEEGFVRIFSVPNFDEFYAIQPKSKQAAAWIEFSSGGNFLTFSADPNNLVVFSMKTLQYQYIFQHNDLPDYVTFAKTTSKMILSCSLKERCVKILEFDGNLWTLSASLPVRHPNGYKVRVQHACFNCDDSCIIVLAANCISCFDTQTKKLINTITHDIFFESSSILAMHPFMPDVAVIGCKTGKASIWDVKKGILLVKLLVEEGPRLTEIIWANDGLTVICADSRGGFTIFGYNKKPFFTMDQFFLYEFGHYLNNNIADNEENLDDNNQQNRDFHERVFLNNIDPDDKTFTDSQGEPLIPQPEHIDISTMNLEISMPAINKKYIDDETSIIEVWRTYNKNELGASSDGSEEESEKSAPESPAEPQKHITTSRMSTRHSISIFDDILSDQFVNYSDESESSIIENDTISYSDAIEEEEKEIKQPDSTSENKSIIRPNLKGYTIYGRASNAHKAFSPEPRIRRKSKTKGKKVSKTQQRRRFKTNKQSVSSDVNSDYSSNQDEDENSYEYEEERLDLKTNNRQTKSRSPRKIPVKVSKKNTVASRKQKQNSKPKSPNLENSKNKRTRTKRFQASDSENQNMATFIRKSKAASLSPKLSNVSKIPEYALWDSLHMKTYVPQVGDRVAYIRDAHQEFEDKCQCNKIRAPFIVMESFPSVAFGVVLDIEYLVTALLIKVHITEPKSADMITQILIPYPLAPQVLVERNKYNTSIEYLSHVKDNIQIDLIKSDKEITSAFIAEIDPEWKNSPYKSITVLAEQDDDPSLISPWDISIIKRKKNDKTISSALQLINFTTFLKRFSLDDDNDDEIFRDWRIADRELDFIKNKIRPVDASMIARRISTDYYRTLSEILEDLKRLQQTMTFLMPHQEEEIMIFVNHVSEKVQKIAKSKHIDIIKLT